MRLYDIVLERLNTQVLRSASGKTIGRIRLLGRVATLEDMHGKKLGTYELDTDVTRNASGRRVGTGNLLGTLLT